MMAFIIILFGKGGLDYLLCMRPGKVMIEMSGMNLVKDLIQWEPNGNQCKSSWIHVGIDV